MKSLSSEEMNNLVYKKNDGGKTNRSSCKDNSWIIKINQIPKKKTVKNYPLHSNQASGQCI